MDIRQLQRAIVKGLEDVKAQNIVVLDTEHLSPFFERVIVASGTSNRQTKALAASVRDTVKTDGWPIPRMEGQENGEWIIVDCGSAVVHVMQPMIRDYYRLEDIWGAKPIALHDANDTAPAKTRARAAVPRKAVAAKKSTAQSRSKPEADTNNTATNAPVAAKAPRKTRSGTVATGAALVARPVRKKAINSAGAAEKPASPSRARKKITAT
jgi:ribosome-associated protein